MKKLILFSIALLFFTVKSSAWGNKGHALVAEVAFHYLDDNTKAMVMKYLGGMSIEDAANWMDSLRDDHSYDYLKPYHYVNYEKDAPVVFVEGDNAVAVITRTIEELKGKGKLKDDEIKTRLLYLFHLIGDVHQPLHAGYGSDQGGNAITLMYNDKKKSLHSLWDSTIIDDQNITLEKCLARDTFSTAERNSIRTIDALSWAKSSRAFLPQIYATENTPTKQYLTDGGIVVEDQILKAGLRLAAVLELVFRQ